METLFTVMEELKYTKASVSRLDTLKNTLAQLKSQNKVLSDSIKELSGSILVNEENLAATDKIAVNSRAAKKSSQARLSKLETSLAGLMASSPASPETKEDHQLPEYLDKQ